MVSRLAVQSEAAIELAEMRAWVDMYNAAPLDWAAEANQGLREIGGALVLHWGATGRRYFSRAVGLGVIAPATEQHVDAILGLWAELGIDMFLLQSLPGCEPAEYEDWLQARGLEPFDRQDRIVRGGDPASHEPPDLDGRSIGVERVDESNMDEWGEFLQRVYRLDTGPWLPELIGRPGWHQFVAREAGEVVAARGMYIGPDGMAWLGMEGPVPGITTDDHKPDAAICAAIVEHGLANGATGFIADIEAPSAEMDTPSYERFAKLGFHVPYTRTHWTVL